MGRFGQGGEGEGERPEVFGAVPKVGWYHDRVENLVPVRDRLAEWYHDSRMPEVSAKRDTVKYCKDTCKNGSC